MNTIVLTGATGFLGSSLLRSLVANQYNIIILKRSFSDTSKINDLLQSVKCYNIDEVSIASIFKENIIDTVIHTATDYGRKKATVTDIVSSNVLFPLELLYQGVQSGHLKTFINTDTSLDKQVSQYSLSKYQFREWLLVYSTNLRCVNVSLEHFYGFEDDKTKFISHVIDKILHNVPSIDLTLGEQQRDFIYIDDVVSAFLTILEHLNTLSVKYNNINIGMGETISIRQSVEHIKMIADNQVTELNFGALPYRSHELMHSNADIRLLQSWGWRPKMSFQEGIKKTIQLEREKLT